MQAHPVIIIWAARSGTNMLRDVITALPGVATWPCDEINYIWRHGNKRVPHDEFTAEMAREPVRRFIRRQFDRMAKRAGARYIVEKTCANSLRVPFVDRVVPEARYLFIVRDGRDVVPSAVKRWHAPLDLAYVAAKARFVPLSDVPYYALRYLWNRVWRLVAGGGRLKTWGPRFKGMEQALRNRSIDEVAALQWVRSVEAAEQAFATMDPGRVLRLRYEDMVADPAGHLDRIGEFLGLEMTPEEARAAVSIVKPGSVGKGRRRGTDLEARIDPIVHEVLKRHGYGD